MKNAIILMTGLFLFAACGKSESYRAKEPPPVAFVGSWAYDGAQVAENAVDAKLTPVNPPAENNVCEGAGATVDAGIIAINVNGTVYSAKKISNVNSAYVRIGKIKPDGAFLPVPGTEKEYISEGYLKLGAGNVSASPRISLRVSPDQKFLDMDIQVVTNSAAGLFVSDVIQTRTFRRISTAQEKALIVEALTCLEANHN
jgi:hypothetical protein